VIVVDTNVAAADRQVLEAFPDVAVSLAGALKDG